MNSQGRLDLEALLTQLKRARLHGARASRLLRYTPALVDLVCPSADDPTLTAADRALKTEQILREAIASLGEPLSDAVEVLLALAPGTLGLKLGQRQERAAELLDLKARAFRLETHEGQLLWDVAVEAYRLCVRIQARTTDV